MSESLPAKKSTRIAVDAMGGDYAPENIVKGAIEALSFRSGLEIYLVGQADAIQKVLKDNNLTFDMSKIINASQVIDMGEHPANAVRSKTDSSIVVGTKMVRDNLVDAFISAGNTGACMTAATLILGRLKGVNRPTIGAIMPSMSGKCAIFDSGANVDSKPQNLLEHALMGAVYAKEIMNIASPRVGILSVGEEDTKGNRVSLDSLELLKKANAESNTGMNFVGNVEGGDILKGTVDVVICDGFVGNIVLKFGEAVPKLLKYLIKKYAGKSLWKKIKVGLFLSSFKEIFKEMDYQEIGGVPLLGVKGISLIGHGSSTPLAIRNMIFRAQEMHERNLLEKMSSAVDIIKEV